MGDAGAGQFWCYMCCQTVNPIMEPETKCPLCGNGFVEEMGRTTGAITNRTAESNNNGTDVESEHSFSLWAPILLGLMGGLGVSRVQRNAHQEGGEAERDFEIFLRNSRRSISLVRQMLHDLQLVSGTLQSGESNTNTNSNSNNSNHNSVLYLNPFTEEAFILQSPLNASLSENPTRNISSSFGDYLIGPGLDLLLQHLAENDPNRHGTPPAHKEAVESMPTVVIEQNLQCSICLEDFEIGREAKEMPCKHKFHGGCILPWLEAHSSCPVCRFQMPVSDSKTEAHELRSTEDRMENDEATTGYSVGDGEQRE